jgi:amino acid adenylation domain-containing protein
MRRFLRLIGRYAPSVDATIVELFESVADRLPDAVAVAEGTRTLTYRELDVAANRIAHGLLARGVGLETPVGVAMDRSAQTIVALLGILKAGGSYVPLDADHPPERLRFIIDDTGAPLVLADPARVGRLPRTSAAIVEVDPELTLGMQHVAGPLRVGVSADTRAYVIYTSGSTGRPKGVEITHRAVLSRVCDPDYVDLEEGVVVLQVGLLSFDLSTFEIWAPLLNGGTVAVYPAGRRDPARVAQAIRDHGASVAMFATGLLHLMIDDDVGHLRGLRQIVVCGDVLSPAHVARVLEELPEARVINGYGPTEATVIATHHPVDAVAAGESIPIGRPLAGARIELLDAEGLAVARGETGELCIGGVGLARGYLNAPALTQERFVADPSAPGLGARLYRTGDLARIRDDGELEFRGRLDHQVKISGYRVEPAEVELHVAAHPGVVQAAVVAREDVPGHKRLVAYVVGRDGNGNGGSPSVAALRAFVGGRLPPYMVPSAFVALERLPITSTGKLDRAALPRPLAGSEVSSARTDTMPANALEAEVADVWRDLLRVEDVRREDDFFELGGDSLLATIVLGRLREAHGVALSIETLFEAPTVAGLAAALADGAASEDVAPPLTRGPASSRAPLAPSQRPAWFFARLEPTSPAYNFCAMLELDGALDVEALQRSLGALIARHEALRTTFSDRDGAPEQVIHAPFAPRLERVDLSASQPDRREGELEALAQARFRRPFDLERLPLIRWTLVRLETERHVLVHAEHHLIHDGWSYNRQLGDLSELYRGFVGGREPALGPPSIQFADYARWQTRLLESDAGRIELEWWRRELQGLPTLALTGDRVRPARPSMRGGIVRTPVPDALVQRLLVLAGETGTTLYMVMVAAFAELLRRYSGQEDFAIGTGAGNRNLRATEDLVGMVANLVGVRVDLTAQPTVVELLGRVRETALAAFAHREVPFGAVVEAVAPERSAAHMPLCQVLFSFHDSPRAPLDFPGLTVRPRVVLGNGSAKADLNVIVIRQPDEPLTLAWEYSSDLFDAGTAERMVGQYVALLEGFISSPQTPASSIAMSAASERAELLARAGVTTPYERDATIAEVFAARAAESPEAPALSFGAQTIGYADLDRRANRLAHRLRGLGVTPRSRVAVCLERGPDMIVSLLAILKAGGAYVAFDPLDPRARLSGHVRRLGISLVVTHALLQERIAGMGCPIICLDEITDLFREPDSPPLNEIGTLDPAYVMYTSGSTGVPRGVEVPQRAVIRLVRGTGYVQLGPSETILGLAPAAFDASTFEIFGALLNGGRLALAPPGPLTLGELAEVVGAERVTTLWLTAGLFHRVVDERPQLLGSLRQLLAGGDVLSGDHVRRALAALPAGAVLINGYGPTEATTFSATHPMRRGETVEARVPIGRPVDNTRIYILDASGAPVPVGVPGELCIGGDGVALGYADDPVATAERFVEDPFWVDGHEAGRMYRSGDRARWRADGTIDFLGRSDGQLKIRGFRVEPGEVEAALRGHVDVADVHVRGFERSNGDRAIAAFVVALAGAQPTDAELRAHAAQTLPAHALPTRWARLERLPLNPAGKIDAAALPVPRGEARGRDRAADARPRDEFERRLTAIWERVLECDDVRPGDDFFALGGHSLLAVEVFEAIERSFGRELPLATIFEAPTVRELAELLRESDWRGGRRSLVPLDLSGAGPPLFLICAGDGNPAGFGALTRRLAGTRPIYALQPRGVGGGVPLDVTIEASAAHYLCEIRSVAPEGPYLLAGRCLGAFVAYEMARRLEAAGEEIALLAILDSGGPFAWGRRLADGRPFDAIMNGALRQAGLTIDLRSDLSTEWLMGWLAQPMIEGLGGCPPVNRYLAEIYRQRIDVRDVWPDLGAAAQHVIDWAWSNGREQYGGLCEQLLPAPSDPALGEPLPRRRLRALGRQVSTAASRLAWRAAEAADLVTFERRQGAAWRRRERLRQASARAARSFIAGRYRGVATLVRSAEYHVHPELDQWYGPDTQIVEARVAGTHRSMLREPDVASLAACMSTLMEAALHADHESELELATGAAPSAAR